MTSLTLLALAIVALTVVMAFLHIQGVYQAPEMIRKYTESPSFDNMNSARMWLRFIKECPYMPDRQRKIDEGQKLIDEAEKKDEKLREVWREFSRIKH